MLEIEVFIDESGLFVETSTDPADQITSHKQMRRFPSQLAGVISLTPSYGESEAEKILKKSCKKSGVEFTRKLHSNEIRPTFYSQFVLEVVSQLQLQKVQPFRIVNEEQLSFGDRVSNYTNILAELLVRICHQYSKAGNQSIAVNVHAAKVVLPDAKSDYIEVEDYQKRIDEYFSRASVRKGYGNQSKNWRIKSFRLGSGKDERLLQVCDVVSNASHDNFIKCDDNAASQLRASLGHFDFSLSSDSFYDEVNEYASQDSFGLAFIAFAQRSVDQLGSDTHFARKLSEAAAGFARLSASAKLPQLRIMMAWLQQSIETRWDLAFSKAAAKWIRKSLIAELGKHETDQVLLKWLEFMATSLLITVQNHLGQTLEASTDGARLDDLIPELAARWEYSSDIFEALIARAVHQNDCFEHEPAIKNMNSVISFFSNLSGFFADAFPEKLFPENVKSDLWAKALGTKVQSQMFLLMQDRCAIDDVRETSDAAIEQFALEDDKARQYQFRSEIEAIAKDWESARRYVAKSLGTTEHSHNAIASKIASLELKNQGFPLLHWTRLGGMAAVNGDRSEVQSFVAALKSNKLTNNQWIIGTVDAGYPLHGILRRMAAVKVFHGDQSGANACISRLRNIVAASNSSTPVFEAILAAAILQVAIILNSDSGIKLLDNKDKKHAGAKQMAEAIVKRTQTSHPEMSLMFQRWAEAITEVGRSKEWTKLASFGRQIGY